jgi:hypothetical protein
LRKNPPEAKPDRATLPANTVPSSISASNLPLGL